MYSGFMIVKPFLWYSYIYLFNIMYNNTFYLIYAFTNKKKIKPPDPNYSGDNIIVIIPCNIRVSILNGTKKLSSLTEIEDDESDDFVII